jgi:hypothetical protein
MPWRNPFLGLRMTGLVSQSQLDVGQAATLDIPGIGHCDDEPVDVDSSKLPVPKLSEFLTGMGPNPGAENFEISHEDCTQLGTFETEHGHKISRNFSRDCTQLGLFETRVPNQNITVRWPGESLSISKVLNFIRD